MSEQTRQPRRPVRGAGGVAGDRRSAWPTARSLTPTARGTFATRVGTRDRPVSLPEPKPTPERKTEAWRHRVEEEARIRLNKRLRGIPVP